MDWSLPPEAQKALLQLARETLERSFSEREEKVLEHFRNSTLKTFPELDAPRPCFVSLHKKPHHLRGCIGCLETEDPLYENVWEYVQHAAFDDPRFPPVKERELHELKIGISVLGPEMPMENASQIEIGKHGLLILQGSKHGVLLAKVATEFNWDTPTFLAETCRKAGLDPKNIDSYEKFYFEEISFEEP